MIRMKGDNYVLRDWEEADLSIYRAWLRPGNEWEKTDAPYYPPFTPDEADEHVANFLAVNNDGSHVPLRLAISPANSSELVGSVSRYWISQDTNWMAAGIAIFDPQYWGKGVGSEALSLWIDYLFDTAPELVRLDLQTWSGNPGMMKLAAKLGFKEEARYRKARIVEGEYYDAIGYGILREEWCGRD